MNRISTAEQEEVAIEVDIEFPSMVNVMVELLVRVELEGRFFEHFGRTPQRSRYMYVSNCHYTASACACVHN